MIINQKAIPISPIEKWLDYYIKFHNLPSISVGIFDLDNKYTFYFGNYDKQKRIKADNRTIYGIGSLSKIYTAIEILKLVEEKKIKLTDKVKDYVHVFPNKSTTIQDLLTHTSGIPRDGDFNFWLNKNFPDEKKASSLHRENKA